VKLDAFRVLSFGLIAVLVVVTLNLIYQNALIDRREHETIEAQKSEYSANIRHEDERKLFLKQEMARGKPQRSKNDCAISLRAIQNKRQELLQEHRRKFPKNEPTVQVMFLICEKNLTWLDGSNFSGPPDFRSGRKCKPGEQRRFSMFGCPLEMIQQLPGPF
jgi:hypothetical protein